MRFAGTMFVLAVSGLALVQPAWGQVVDGSITSAEHGAALAVQDTPSQFSGPESFEKNKLDAAFGSLTPDGDVFLGLAGNLQIANSGFGSNALIVLVDSRPGGAIASTDTNGFGTLGSIGGVRLEQWGSDIDPSAGATANPASVLDPGFNPDFAIEIIEAGSTLIPPIPPDPNPIIVHGEFIVNLIDLTLPNDGAAGLVTELGRVTTDPAAPLSSRSFTTSFTPSGSSTIPAGMVTFAADNSNTGGALDFTDSDGNGIDDSVEGGTFQANVGTGAQGDPLTQVAGLEFLFSTEFLGNAGQAIKVLPFITNNGGGFLSNQFLVEDPFLAGAGNCGGPDDPNNPAACGGGGDQLFDASLFAGNQFITIGAEALDGDLDGDGFVGITDLNLVLSNWNQFVTAGDLGTGDPSGDGFVGIEDLNVILGNWNAGTPPSASAVPEPTTLALLGVGMVLSLRRRGAGNQ